MVLAVVVLRITIKLLVFLNCLLIVEFSGIGDHVVVLDVL